MLFDIILLTKNSLGYKGLIVINNITKNDISYRFEINSIKTSILKMDDMKIKRENNLIVVDPKIKKKLTIGNIDTLKFTGIGHFPDIKDFKMLIDKY